MTRHELIDKLGNQYRVARQNPFWRPIVFMVLVFVVLGLCFAHPWLFVPGAVVLAGGVWAKVRRKLR